MTGTERETPAGRVPGRYIVYGFVVFWVFLFGGSWFLSKRLEPAAQRFHNPDAAPTPTVRE